MSERVITVENISKAYRIGLKEEMPDTFVGAMTGWLKAPIRNYQRLRRLNTFNKAVHKPSPADRQQNSKHSSTNANRQPSLDSPLASAPCDEQEDIVWALRDVSFEVQKGQCLGVIGRNGAGKSTLLKVLSRITEPTSGRAIIHGRVSSLLEVGTGFHPDLTGRENVYMNGTILGMRKREIDQKFDEIVAFSGVEKFLDTPIKRYSSGMQVRLAFAVAAHLEPEILVVDEVLAVGDAEFQKKCLGKMQDVARSGRTVLFVSHNMAAVQSFCTRSLVLRQGQIDFEGDTESAIRSYLAMTNQSEAAEFDLQSHASRRPDSVPLLRKVRLLDSNGQPSTVFRSGENVAIEIDVDPIASLSTPHFGVGVDDALGSRLFTVATHLSKNKLPALTAPSTVRCSINSLPLAPGKYLMSLYGGTVGGWLDELDRALGFEVQQGDFYGNGRPPRKALGTMLVRSEWSRKPEHAISALSVDRE